MCGKADHCVKEPEINIWVGKASRGDFRFSNPNIITSVVGMYSSPEQFKVQSVAICLGGFLTTIAFSRPDAMALNCEIIIYYLILENYGIFLKLRYSPFWYFMHSWLVVSNWCFRTTFQSHLQGSNVWIVWPLTTGLIGSPETSKTNFQSALCNIPEEWTSHLLCCRCTKSHIFGIVCICLHVLHIPIDTTSNILWMPFTGVRLTFTSCCWWGFKTSGLWHCTARLLIADILKEHTVFIFKGWGVLEESRTQPLKMKVIPSFKILGINNPDTQCDNPAVLDMHLFKIKIIKTWMQSSLMSIHIWQYSWFYAMSILFFKNTRRNVDPMPNKSVCVWGLLVFFFMFIILLFYLQKYSIFFCPNKKC